MSEIQPVAGTRTADIVLNPIHEERIRQALRDALAPSTRVVYDGAIRHLRRWAESEGFTDPLSPIALASYLTSRVAEGRKISTITIALAAVRQLCLELDVPDPGQNSALRRTVSGIRRQLAGNQVVKAHAITTAELIRIVGGIDRTTNSGKRDTALLMVLYAGALRRSEAVSLLRGDVRIASDGAILTLRRSKTDQLGEGAVVGIVRGTNHQTDPVGAIARLIAARAPLASDDPIFTAVSRGDRFLGSSPLSARSVNRILQARAASVGLEIDNLTGHSGRAGHITTSALAGVPIDRIARTSRHKSLAVLAAYIRPATVLGDTSSSSLGL